MGLSGLVAGGVDDALEQVLERRLREQMRQQQERESQERIAVQRETLAAAQQDRAADNERQQRVINLAELKRTDDLGREQTQKNAASDMAGVLAMPGMSNQDKASEIMGSGLRTGQVDPAKVIEGLTRVQPGPKMRAVTTKGDKGQPINRMVPEDEAVEEFRAPQAPTRPERDPIADRRAILELEREFKAKDSPQAPPSAYSQERATRTAQSVDDLAGKVSRWSTGVGSILSSVPETDARNFAAELDTLKANIAFNELTAMREASKTGGALGAVSDKEMQLLQSALGALDAGQSPANIKAQLQKIKESVQRWQAAGGQGGESKPASKFTIVKKQ